MRSDDSTIIKSGGQRVPPNFFAFSKLKMFNGIARGASCWGFDHSETEEQRVGEKLPAIDLSMKAPREHDDFARRRSL